MRGLGMFLLGLQTVALAASTFNAPSSIPTCLGQSGPNDYTPTCFANPSAPRRNFTLVFTWISVPGYPKQVVGVNGTYPGPTLEMTQFDIVSVTLVNQLGMDTALHFHGARQYRSPQADGVPGLTQCPVAVNATMTYTFCADRSGSYWYHSHFMQQYPDGMYGVYLVHPATTGDIYGPQYNYDIPLLLADFYNVNAESLVPWYLSTISGGAEPVPDAFIANGRFTRQLVYAVPNNAKIRLRFISAAAFSLFNVSVDGIPMTVIEADGVDTYPYEVSSVPLNVAQRVSVLLDLSQSKATATYIRVVASLDMFDPDLISPTLDPTLLIALYLCDPTATTPAGPCASPLSPGLAPMITPLPNLNSANFNSPLVSLGYTDAVYAAQAQNEITDINMMSCVPLYPAYSLNSAAACYDIYAPMMTDSPFILPLTLSFNDDAFGINRGYFNNITYDTTQQFSHLYQTPLSSPSPLLYELTQQGAAAYRTAVNSPSASWANISDPSIIDQYPSLQNQTWSILDSNVLGQYVLPGNTTVDVLLVNTDSGSHPIHMHGYAVWLVASSEMPNATAPFLLRDIVSLPPMGWARVRLRTDNPGVWIVHCHISWHLDAGLAAVFIDNLPALQTDPDFAYPSLIPSDHQAACDAYDPDPAPPPVAGICITAPPDNDFLYKTSVAQQARWAMTADLVIMSEAFIGLLMYKLGVLNYLLPELICMNIGTLIGAVFIEFVHELYEQVYLAQTLTYLNVTIIMCFGFIVPFVVEKFIKRGRASKFKILQQRTALAVAKMAQPPADSTVLDSSGSGSVDAVMPAANGFKGTIANDDTAAANGHASSSLQRIASISVRPAGKKGFSPVPRSEYDAETVVAVADTMPQLEIEMDPIAANEDKTDKLERAPSSTLSGADFTSKDQLAGTQGSAPPQSSMQRMAAALADDNETVDWTLIGIILAGESLDIFVDGGVIAAAFLSSTSAGLAAAVGVFMEELMHMTGSFAVFVGAGASLWKCVLINCLSASCLLLGSGFILGTASVPGVNPAHIVYLLAFAVGSYLYVALVDLTPFITNMPWTGWRRATTAVCAVLFGLGVQASIAVYDWKEKTS